jgi:hypothetical protein
MGLAMAWLLRINPAARAAVVRLRFIGVYSVLAFE